MRKLLVLAALACMGNAAVSGDVTQLGVPFDSVSQALVHVNSALTPESGSSGNGVIVSLCGAKSCCAIWVTGMYNNSLKAQTVLLQYTNTLSSSPRYNQITNAYKGPSLWEPKDLSLVVRNEYQLFGAWLESAPDSDKMWVQCPPDAKYLHVSSSVVGSSDISILDADGKGYSKVPEGPVLQLGELVSLNVTAASGIYWSSFVVGLCGSSSCAAVTIAGPSGNTFTYRSALTSNNMPDSAATAIFQNNLYSRNFPLGFNFNVSVALHPDRFLQVWIPSDMSVVLTLPVPDAIWNSSPSLKVAHDAAYVTYTSVGIRSRHSLPNPYSRWLDSNATLPLHARR